MRDCVLSLMLDTLDPGLGAPDGGPASEREGLDRAQGARAGAREPERAAQIADICRSLAVSRRSLQYAFEDLAGMGAVEFLRNVRLNAGAAGTPCSGRDPLDEPIAAIAARWELLAHAAVRGVLP